ncbi:hypothetical protein A33M_1233 [Rhodovulum sp. PH10]|uniref:LapA family protein n=1 Tax=Rhodovulum sp. PH10 TaxID=1187851 RepID=UPI00027C20ED|nr:LapA family protein [Rhodovulum sp. PH10]EJW09507.1 hypothetical protein A33M_1233 [Rhodovulum sp. PH10]
MIRRTLAVIVLVPLAIVVVALALVNRHTVPVSLDPFSNGDLANAVQVPMFLLVIGLLAVGVLIGGIATWLGQGRWRRTARRSQSELRQARAEIGDLKRRLNEVEDDARRWPPRAALQRPAA